MDELLSPAYWPVFGLEWSGCTPLAEAAVAIAPGVIPRDQLIDHAYQVLGCADLQAARRSRRVGFFTDLTRTLTAGGHSWAGLGVDWLQAIQELGSGSFPTLFLTISQQAYLVLCDPATRILAPGRTACEPAEERDLLRQAIADRLATDWPPYIRSLTSAGRVRLAG